MDDWWRKVFLDKNPFGQIMPQLCLSKCTHITHIIVSPASIYLWLLILLLYWYIGWHFTWHFKLLLFLLIWSVCFYIVYCTVFVQLFQKKQINVTTLINKMLISWLVYCCTMQNVAVPVKKIQRVNLFVWEMWCENDDPVKTCETVRTNHFSPRDVIWQTLILCSASWHICVMKGRLTFATSL